MKSKKNPKIDPNKWLPADVAKEYSVVGWNFGPLIHLPSVAHLGHPNGQINLKDITPKYAAQLVAAGCKYFRKKKKTEAAPIDQPE